MTNSPEEADPAAPGLAADDAVAAPARGEARRRAGVVASLRHLTRRTAHMAASRAKAGAIRARYSWMPALQMTVAGVGAFVLAEAVFGHSGPIFAAVAAMIALGFTKEPRLRKIIEVSIGCTLGIFIGDTMLHTFGSGPITAASVVFVSVILARFLDSSSLLAMQMGLQALLVVMIPAPEAGIFGPFSRSADAVLGGVTAMVVALATPKDPRREPIREVSRAVDELAAALRETASGIRQSESREAWHALIRTRGIQPQLDDVHGAVTSARELTRYSPAYRRHRHYVRSMGRVAEQTDLAVRSMRLVARRAVSVIDHAALGDPATRGLGKVLDEFADAVQLISRAVGEPGPAYERRMEDARDRLIAVAMQLHPARLRVDTLEGEAVVMLVRTMVVDVMIGAGIPAEEAADYLPGLRKRSPPTGTMPVVDDES